MFRIVVERNAGVLEDRLFGGKFVSIGRSRDNDVVLEDPSVSASHVVIKSNDDGTLTAINQSSGGTMVGGNLLTTMRIDRPVELAISDYTVTVLPVPDSGETTEASLGGSDSTTVSTALPEPPVPAGTVETPMSASVRVQLTDGTSREFPVGLTTMIGRSHDADVQLDSPDVSRNHCTLFRRSGGHYIKRLARVNPVLVNGRELKAGETQRLYDGDVIDVCGYLIAFATHGATSHRIPEGGGNLGMSVRTGGTGPERTLEVIGFLGGKNVVAFDREMEQAMSGATHLTIDVGYLVGIDDGGIDSIEKAIRAASMQGTSIRIEGASHRVLDIIRMSSKRGVIEPHLGTAAPDRKTRGERVN